MAHPPDEALSRAISEVLHEVRNRGMTTRGIADYFAVTDSTVYRWEGSGRVPALSLLPAFDRLAGQPRGHVLRLAGYVSDEIDLAAAIASAPDLDDMGRDILAKVYEIVRVLTD
jgi:hypothetical protein